MEEVEEEEAAVEVSILATMPLLPNLANEPQFPYKFQRIFCVGAHTASTNVSYPRMLSLHPSPIFEVEEAEVKAAIRHPSTYIISSLFQNASLQSFSEGAHTTSTGS